MDDIAETADVPIPSAISATLDAGSPQYGYVLTPFELAMGSESELSTPPTSQASSSGSDSSSDDDAPALSGATVPRKHKLYIRKKKAVGPAADKTFLTEGLYANGACPPSSSTLSLTTDSEDVKPERKRAKKRTFWDYQTILPDGTVLEGKIGPLTPARSTAGDGQGASSGDSTPAESDRPDDVVGVRSRLRGRASLPSSFSASTSLLSLPVLAPSDPPSDPSSSSSSSATPTSVPLPLPSGIISGTRSRPRASLPSSSSSTPAASATPRRPKKVDAPFSFPLPLHRGLTLLDGERDFELSYDIIWELENDVLVKKKDKRKPPKFKQLAKNTFPERGRDMDPTGPAICSCVPPPEDSDEMGCGDKCMNRMMQYLCHPKTCPCGDRCSNKSLYKREGPQTKVFWTGNRGFGLQALEDIPEGTFVIDYRGEIIEIATYYTRILTTYASRGDFYALEYGEGEVIDACQKGNNARFVNHGCSPNLEVRKFTTLGEGVEEYEVGLWASRDIKAGEELFYDYNFDSFSNRPSKIPAGADGAAAVAATQEGNGRQRCTCGAEGCSGWIGGKKAVDPKGKGKAKAKEEEEEVKIEPAPTKLVSLVPKKKKPGPAARKRAKLALLQQQGGRVPVADPVSGGVKPPFELTANGKKRKPGPAARKKMKEAAAAALLAAQGASAGGGVGNAVEQRR